MVGPLVMLGTIVVLLVAARFYDRSPVQLPPCSFKEKIGIPCVACRGTRSFKAIARGKVVEASKLNPGAALAVGFSAFWVISYLLRKGDPPSRRIRPRVVGWTIGILIALNWLFLIFTDHWYP